MRKLFLLLTFTFLFAAIACTSYAQTRVLAETFNGVTFPPTGWVVTNAGTGNSWLRTTTASYIYEGAGAMQYQYSTPSAANTWAFTSNIAMTAGNTYYVVFYESNAGGTTYPEKLKVTVGQGQTVANQTTTVSDYPNITNTTYARQQTANFVAPTSGNYNFAFNCYSAADQFYLNVDSVNIYEVPAVPMVYVSSTTTQAITSTVPAGSTNQQIIGIQIVTSGSLSPFNLTELDLNTNGSSNPNTDITLARVFSTGTSSTFSTSSQFGADYSSPNGAFSVNGTLQLQTGTNYFWLVYNIPTGANIGDVVDGECNQILMDGVGGTQVPTVQAPAGTRTIVSPISGSVYVGTGQTYTTLTGTGGLFEAINTYGLNGNIIANITSDITEPGTNALSQWTEVGGSGYTLNIVPATGSLKTISGSVASPGMITFNGTDRVTIDGNNGFTPGGPKYLLFRNTNASNPAITFINDATYNTITNCTIETGTSSAQVGGILFSTTTGTLGNSNNMISYCDVRDRTDASSIPLCCIVSNGTSTAQNSNNTIDHCNIYNFYSNGNPGIGVYLITGSTAFTVSNNSFYQTVTRTSTTTSTRLFPIYISNSLGDNFQITGNYIGGTAPLCGGTAMTLTTATTGVANIIYGITISGSGTTIGSSIQGNTIQNINLTTIPPTGANQFNFVGLNLATGSFYVGNITGNTIGAATGNGSITINDNGNALTSSFGFYVDCMEVSPTGACNISNNTLGSFTLAGTSTTGASFRFVRGILLVGSPTSAVTLNNNLFGSTTTTNSIYANMTTTTRPQGLLPLIISLSSAQTTNVTNNTFMNITNKTTGTTNTATTVITSAGSGIANITGNTIQEISSSSLLATTTPGSNTVTGVYINTATINQNVSGNTIRGLRSTTANSLTNGVYGIAIAASGSTGTVAKNRLFDLTNVSTNVAGRIYGTSDYLGATWTYSNNQITLTNGETSANKKEESNGSYNLLKRSSDVISKLVPGSDLKTNMKAANDDIDARLMSYAAVKLEMTKLSKDGLYGPVISGSVIPNGIRESLLLEKKLKSQDNGYSVENVNNEDIQGFHEEFTSGNTGNYYYNSVYIGGSASSGAANSYCFGRLTTATPTVNLRNNIFYNARTGGTGFHLAIYSQSTSTTGWGANASNYNVLITPNSSIVGRWGTTTNYDIAGWRTISNGDKQSWSTTTSVISAANLFNSISTGNLGIQTGNMEAWIVSGKGIALASQNSDFSGNTRATSISGGCTDIGSVEFAATPPGNPVATQTGTPGPGATSTYTLYGRTICSIAWSADAGGSIYPSLLNVNYYPGVAPGNTLGGNFSNSHTTITIATGTFFNASYDLTYFFGDNETNTITTPASNTTLAKYDPSSWEVFQAGTGVYQNQLTYNTSTAVYSCKVVGLPNFSDFALTDLTSPLPVDLCQFNGSAINRDVSLLWQTCREINNKGFDVERRIQNDVKSNSFGPWEKVVFITGHGTTNQPETYSFKDTKLSVGKYQYRLKQIDYNNSTEYYNLESPNLVEIGKPISADVSQNYPNPSNPKSKIDYQIPFNGKVSLKVYDIIGREVVTVVNEVKEAGFYTAEFDGTNLASGVYFYRILAEGDGQKFLQTKKMILVK